MQKSQQLNSLKSNILNKGKEPSIIEVYHYLMIHYGYIPFEEFKKMDAGLVEELIGLLNKLNEKGSKK